MVVQLRHQQLQHQLQHAVEVVEGDIVEVVLEELQDEGVRGDVAAYVVRCDTGLRLGQHCTYLERKVSHDLNDQSFDQEIVCGIDKDLDDSCDVHCI